MYSLKGDRHFEYKFAGSHIGKGDGWALDIGPGARGRLAVHAIKQGWNVIAVDLVSCQFKHPKFTHIQQDFATVKFDRKFDLIINVSSIEHFGIPGRYGVTEFDAAADLRAMQKARDLMNPGAKMILTIPLGKDAVLIPFHRVYGREYLPRLFSGYTVTVQEYWNKRGNSDNFVRCSQNDALDTKPTLKPAHYYALGCFLLEATNGT